jgi:hypothetical protein
VKGALGLPQGHPPRPALPLSPPAPRSPPTLHRQREFCAWPTGPEPVEQGTD